VLSFTTGLRTGVATLSFFFGIAALTDESVVVEPAVGDPAFGDFFAVVPFVVASFVIVPFGPECRRWCLMGSGEV
jgi:hypothetical protein